MTVPQQPTGVGAAEIDLPVGRTMSGPWIVRFEPGRLIELRTMPAIWAYIMTGIGGFLGLAVAAGQLLLGAFSESLAGLIMATLFCSFVFLIGLTFLVSDVRNRLTITVGESFVGTKMRVEWSEVLGARARFFHHQSSTGRRVHIESQIIVSVFHRAYAGSDAEVHDIYTATCGTQFARTKAQRLAQGLNDALRTMGLEWSEEAEKIWDVNHPAPSPESQLPLGYGALSKAMGYDMEAQQQQMHLFAQQLGLTYRHIDSTGLPAVSGTFNGSAVRIEWHATTAFDQTTQFRAAFTTSLGVGLVIRRYPHGGAATGDPAFDGQFTIAGRDPSRLQEIVDAETRRLILEALAGQAIPSVDDEGVTYSLSGAIKDVSRAAQILQHVVSVAQHIERRET